MEQEADVMSAAQRASLARWLDRVLTFMGSDGFDLTARRRDASINVTIKGVGGGGAGAVNIEPNGKIVHAETGEEVDI